ncbi:AMIN domain-containing protein [bacterium]|nr:AMIN domain-containing protein [bacterium]
MGRLRKIRLIGMITFILLVSSWSALFVYAREISSQSTAKSSSRVTDVDFKESDQKTRVLISVKGPIKYRHTHFAKDKEELLVVDILDAIQAKPYKVWAVNRGAVTKIRSAQHSTKPDVVRVVVHLKEKVPYQTKDTANQIVLDIANPKGKPALKAQKPSTKFRARAPKPSQCITLNLKDADIREVLHLLSQKSRYNIIASKGVTGTISISLKEVTVEEALDAIVGAYGYTYMKKANIITVMTSAELRGVEEVEELKTRIFPLKYARASILAKALSPLTSRKGKVTTDERSNQIILIDTQEKIEEIGKIISRLDKKTQTRVFKLRHAQAKDLIPLLTKIKSKYGEILSDVRTNTLVITEIPSILSKMGDMIKEWDRQTKTRIFTLNYAKPKEIKTKLEKVISKKEGEVYVDERTNTVVVIALPDLVSKAKDLIAAWDKKTRQVLIEARVVEISLTEEEKLGIDWEYRLPQTDDLAMKGTFPQALAARGVVTVGTLSRDDYTIMLEMLKDSTDTNILSHPRITTLDNEKAEIVVGTKYPIATYQLVKETGTYEITGWSEVEYGVRLTVTPQINEEGYIIMEIHPEVSHSIATVGTSPHERPVISTQEANAQVMIKDGETVVLGGFIKEKESKREQGIPYLRKIPLLGHLFKKSTKEKIKTDLLIFITANILKEGAPLEDLPPAEESLEEKSESKF